MHALNRGVRRGQLFYADEHYQAFMRVFSDAVQRVPTRVLAYCVMPNHWHLVLWPIAAELPQFMHRLTLIHAKRWHFTRDSRGTGSVYQNRYTAIPVQTETHLITLLRYVERNPLRAKLVKRAEDWPWSSLAQRCNSTNAVPLFEWPISQPDDWVEMVNQPQTEREFEDIRTSLQQRRPLGDPSWSAEAASRVGLPTRHVGRPKSNRV